MSLKRLTDLFEEGTVLQVVANDGSVIPFWIAKPNPFEEEQATHEARTARARLILAIKEVGTDESKLFEAGISEMTEPEMVDQLVADKTIELTAKAIREVQHSEDWGEKLRLAEQSADQIRDLPEDDPERVAIEKVTQEATDEIDRITAASVEALHAELSDLTRQRLVERMLENYAERRGMARFTEVRTIHQVWMCLRQCMGTVDANGRWDHSECDHSVRWLDKPEEVTRMPASFFQQVQAAYNQVTVPHDTARFSEGPASSSASSGPASTQEGSKPSGQEGTPAGPASTSS